MSFWPVSRKGSRMEAPHGHGKPRAASRRYTGGAGVVYEVREWGTYPNSGKRRFTTWMVRGGETAVPMDMPSLVRPSFKAAEKALAAFAKRGCLMEVER